MSKVECLPSVLSLPSEPTACFGSEMAANGNEQKVNMVGVTA